MVVRLPQLLNILHMDFTLAVLKLQRSRLVKPMHPSNMKSVIVTFAVLNLVTSRLFKALQS